MENNTLQHHGIIGMKWGVRRYQTKNGSLTKAGQRRYAKDLEKAKAEQKRVKEAEKTQAKLDKLKAMQDDVEVRKKALKDKDEPTSNSKKSDAEPKKKSIRDMSDDELRAVVNRLQLEQQYKNLNPKHESAGKKFLTKAFNSMVDGGVQVLKDYTVNQLKKKLGLEKEPDQLARLKKEIDKINTERQYKELTDPTPDPLKELEREYKTLAYKKNIRTLKEDKK